MYCIFFSAYAFIGFVVGQYCHETYGKKRVFPLASFPKSLTSVQIKQNTIAYIIAGVGSCIFGTLLYFWAPNKEPVDTNNVRHELPSKASVVPTVVPTVKTDKPESLENEILAQCEDLRIKVITLSHRPNHTYCMKQWEKNQNPQQCDDLLVEWLPIYSHPKRAICQYLWEP